MQEQSVQVSIQDGQLRINDARVVLNDLRTSNGIIHVIDSVLLPPQQATNGRKGLGFYLERPSRALAAQLDLDRHAALVITRLTRGGNARTAGLERYDVITRINGRPASNDSLRMAKAETAVGAPVQLRLLRRGESVTVDVPLGVERH